MSLNVYDQSAGLFLRGLTNLQGMITKAGVHVADAGETALLKAQLNAEGHSGSASASPHDLHRYTLAAQVHWAAEGARLAIARLLGVQTVPVTSEEASFAELHQHLDATIVYLRQALPSDLEAGLDRTIVIQHRRGSMTFRGGQFLLEFAVPHFYYHLAAAYGILRNQGVQLTMGDFLGS